MWVVSSCRGWEALAAFLPSVPQSQCVSEFSVCGVDARVSQTDRIRLGWPALESLGLESVCRVSSCAPTSPFIHRLSLSHSCHAKSLYESAYAAVKDKSGVHTSSTLGRTQDAREPTSQSQKLAACAHPVVSL